MSNKRKLARMTDLFSLGEVVFLGDDETGVPQCIWVAKLNSFQESEAQRDGMTGRMAYIVAFTDTSSDEYTIVSGQVDDLNNDELVDALVKQHYEEDQILAVADIDSDEVWRERLDFLYRQPELLEDASKENHEDMDTWEKFNKDYLKEAFARTDKRQETYKNDISSLSRDDLVEKFIEGYKDRNSVENYLNERAVTRLYYAMRDCDATRVEDGKWNHEKCNHQSILAESRKEIRELPQDIINKCSEALERVTVAQRDVENFPATTNS